MRRAFVPGGRTRARRQGRGPTTAHGARHERKPRRGRLWGPAAVLLCDTPQGCVAAGPLVSRPRPSVLC